MPCGNMHHHSVTDALVVLSNEVIFTPSPVAVWSIVMSVSVCLSVCMPVNVSICTHISEICVQTTRPNFTKFSFSVDCGRGSVLH